MLGFDIAHTTLFAESWNVAWRRKEPGSILADKQEQFNIIENSWRYWAADPFVFEYEGNAYVFAELYDYVRRRGIIGYYQLDENKKGKWIPVIVGERHMSYPCIVEYRNKVFMLPETSQDKELVVYEAVRFPTEWKKICVLRTNVAFADTTPFPGSSGQYALTFQLEDVCHPELTLLDLRGEKPDVIIRGESHLKTRPAGMPFTFNGKNIRPAQHSIDYANGYGKSILFYEYQFDCKMSYSEELISELKPDELCYSKNLVLDGMHTYNASANYEVIDIKTRRFSLLNFVFRVIGKIENRIKN